MTILHDIFPSVSAKILQYLISAFEKNPHVDYDRYMISRNAGITTRSLARWLPILRKEGLITLTRHGGTNELLEFYRLSDNIATNHLVKFWETL